jgi:hypothetical protein
MDTFRVRFVAVFAIALLAFAGCERRGNERWATTENTNLEIDWNKVNEAYRLAEGPVDLEKRLNEIYEGDEVISVAVQDLDAKTQVVTGFFDKDKSGTVQEGEKIFTIRREVTGDGAAQFATQGYGPYGGYHSPMMGLVTGMVMGSMMSRALSPGYVPVYRQPYTTSVGRASEIGSRRASYRAQNPSRVGARPKASGSGRFYGSPGRSGGRMGGGRFGIRRAGRPGRKPERLTA